MLELRDFDRAEPLYHEALAAFREIREHWWTAGCLKFLAQVANGRGDHARAALLLGGVSALLESSGARLIPREAKDHEEAIQQAEQTLGTAAFQQAFEHEHTMPLDTLLVLVLDRPTGSRSR
jgi:hypothetical protein